MEAPRTVMPARVPSSLRNRLTAVSISADAAAFPAAVRATPGAFSMVTTASTAKLLATSDRAPARRTMARSGRPVSTSAFERLWFMPSVRHHDADDARDADHDHARAAEPARYAVEVHRGDGADLLRTRSWSYFLPNACQRPARASTMLSRCTRRAGVTALISATSAANANPTTKTLGGQRYAARVHEPIDSR